MTDAELIERARVAARHGYAGSPGPLLEALADRIADLTKPTPWRSVEELPEPWVEVWVRCFEAGATRAVVGATTSTGKWFATTGKLYEVTGWQPIVRPEP